ncbi:hypothetical protein E2C01_078611 [Portunus trituberculatus]|uniref:Uncharacterized protein n=1 Tax=Portunus trituberculatus TaxID=210409 RepID=A0A5B7IHD2_PORTR|nr:hypothetical protein [Portunus trituberculatus]
MKGLEREWKDGKRRTKRLEQEGKDRKGWIRAGARGKRRGGKGWMKGWNGREGMDEGLEREGSEGEGRDGCRAGARGGGKGWMQGVGREAKWSEGQQTLQGTSRHADVTTTTTTTTITITTTTTTTTTSTTTTTTNPMCVLLLVTRKTGRDVGG